MRGIPSLLFFLTFIFVLSNSAWGQSEQVACIADNHRQPHPRGQMIVTEYALSAQGSNCPMSRYRTAEPVPFVMSSVLHFWFRLQGDVSFLTRADRGQHFVASYFRANDGRWIYEQRDVDMKSLTFASAAQEARGADGLFDWRVVAEKKAFDVPGTYQVRILYGDELICPAGESGPSCGIVFTVKEP
jgi:hypothetical protein